MARILTLTNWYPPHHFGGYEVLCADVMEGLHARGHEVHVLCSDAVVPGAPPVETSPFPVHRRLAMYWRDGAPWTPPLSQRVALERANQRTFDEVVTQVEPDVISVWHLGAISLSLLTSIRRRRLPVVYAVCDDWLVYGIALDPWSRLWNPSPLRRLAGHGAARILRTPAALPDLGAEGCFCFLSRFTRESARLGSPWTFAVDPVVYPGITRSAFAPPDDAPPRAWGWRLLYTGRLDPRKGTDTLLRALAKLPPEATVSFLGRGEQAERARLERLAGEMGLAERVVFDPVTRAQLPEAYASHDCFIFPSEWPEPFGMVPLEAMASGTPVVATGVGGSAEFLADRVNCLMFTPGDEVGLSEAVLRLAESPALRATLRRGGWRCADEFDVGSTVDAYDRAHTAAAGHELASLTLAPHPSGVRDVPGHPPPALPAAVLARVDAVDGPVLHLGTGPGAVGTDRDPAVPVVELRYAPGPGAGRVQVEGDPLALPFADASFAGVLCQDLVGRVQDPAALIRELARVTRRSGTVTVVAPSRHNAAVAGRRLRDWWRGWRRSPAQYVASDFRRAYSLRELEALVAGSIQVTGRAGVGWPEGSGRLRRWANAAVEGPLRGIGRSVLVTGSVR